MHAGAEEYGRLVGPIGSVCLTIVAYSFTSSFSTAGRLYDILNELACAGEIPVDKATPPPSNKRERGSDSPVSTASSPPAAATPPDGPRPIASRRNLPSGVTTPAGSQIAGAGGLPYDTAYLGSANLEMVAGMMPPATSSNMGGQWVTQQQTQTQTVPVPGVGSSSTADAQQQNIYTSQTAMPNLNIFDFFQSDPQLFSMPMMDQGYVPNMGSSSIGFGSF